MNKMHTTTFRGLTTRKAVWALAIGFACTGASAQVVVQAEAVDAIDLQVVGQEEPSLDLAAYQPGFSLHVADEDLQKQIAELNKYLEASDWAKAFRLLTELKDEQLQVMAPIGGEGQHVLVKEQLQRQLLSLPPEGRRAFRLYFDGQATEQFDKIKNHPLPGSEAQLILTQALVDRLLASSVGGEAAVLLGDMYFERGMFDKAGRNWQLALEHGSATGTEALTLQAKRTLAMKRAGKSAEAQSLLDSLRSRYGSATIQAGGEEVDALALLGQSLDQPAAQQADATNKLASKNLLPAPNASPAWHMKFLNYGNRNAVSQVLGQRSYYSPPTDIVKFVPPVVADDERVYFQWLGVVFALDRETGSIVWQARRMKETAATALQRIQSNHGDSRNYRLAISDDFLLVTTTQNNNQGSPFVLKAYDAENGEVRWSSDTREDWSLSEPDKPQKGVTALLGEVVMHEGWAYAVVCRTGQNSLFLRRFDPSNGKVDWTIPLGSAEIMAFQYTQVNRLPQPIMMMGQSLLYVMTNNGALLAVDVIASEVQWAVRMTPPFGIGNGGDQNPFRGNQLSGKLNALTNSNGSGRLLLQDDTLYAKEHNGSTLYALDPTTGKVNWSAGKLKPDAKLIAIDDERFYLMDRALHSYRVDGNHDLITKNGVQTGSPDHAGAIPLDDNILIYGDRTLRLLDKQHLDPAGKYENIDHLGNKGGRLYLFDDLLIAIDTTQITAFNISDNDN